MLAQPDRPHTLRVCCYAGLGNRLRVLISGLALAEASGRQFQMIWPRTPAGSATFPELFQNELDIVETAPDDIDDWPSYGAWFSPPLPDFLAATTPQLKLVTTDWLLQPALYPGHTRYGLRCAALLNSLRPVASLQAQVDSFREAHFRPYTIGVHLRRGDFLGLHPNGQDNTGPALAAVAQQLEQHPEAGILLCSDDGAMNNWTRQAERGGVREQFVQRFGERVFSTTPRTLDRSRPEAMQDALVDLLLLRQTQALVGTRQSSFSEMAVFGRRVPVVLCEPSVRGAPQSWAGRALQAVGVDGLVRRAIFWRYGKEVPARILLYHLSERPRRWLRGLLQRYWPGLYRRVRARRGLPEV